MSVTVQTIPQNPSTVLKDINGYFVPNILSFSLKKTSEDQPATETDDSVSRQNGEIITETDGGPKMSPKRNGGIRGKHQTSSFLLDPFFKPVAHNIESNKENPVLKALFGGNKHNLAPWSYVSKTPMTNCHPFKKTEFSHDLTSDDIPAKVPKSLMKKPSKVKKVFNSNSNSNNINNNSNIISSNNNNNNLNNSLNNNNNNLNNSLNNNNNNLNNSLNNNKCRNGSICNNNNSNNYTVNYMRRGSSPENRTNNTKAFQLTRAHVSSTSTISLVDSDSRPDRKQPMSVEKVIDSGNNNKRKKITSQVSLPYARACEKSRALQVNAERLIQLRAMVDDAIKSHKVYSMTGCYNSVRNALKQRGWVEKIDCDVKGRRKINRFEEIGQYEAAFQFVQKNQTVAAMRLSMQTNSGFAHNDQIHYTGQGEAEIINRMLKNVTEDLCWLSRPYPYYCYKDFDKFEMINRLPRAFFSNKIGLCNSLQQMQWFYETGVCSTKFPRTYNMSAKDEIDAFKEDYRLTSCINLLKWFIQTYRSGGEKAVRSLDGKIESNVIEFAMRRCAEFVKGKQHEDIDVADSPTVWDYQWDTFISQYYKVINDGYILRETKDKVGIKGIVSNVQSMLNIVKPYWPQFDIDGYQNFWIVKPGGRCCGAGIVIKNNLEQILGMVNPGTMKETRFVVQKYIERPLLIYNTKFDIRQWFLVTNVYPLTIWMYRESYLRFCSQPFTLKSTHESIHLCNNAVQRRYKNAKRDRGLPDENMWDCYTFQTYLKAIGHPEAWDKYIYPGMKEGFIGALLASQDSMEKKRNCFELYGADFMLSDTLTDGPWLIEINSNPAMDSSTSVTGRMCPQVLEDIIKVVIDRRDNKNAPTGAFEMVFRQNCPPVPPYLGMSLCVKGQKAYKHSGDNRSFCKKSKNKESSDSLPCTDTEEESMAEKAVSNSNISTSEKTTEKETELNSNISTLKETRAKETVLDWNISILKETLKKGTNPLNQSDLRKKDSVLVKTSLKGRKERSKKHRKVDWVRKNIEDLKSLNSTKQSKSPRQHDSRTPSPKKLKANNTFRDELLKLLNVLEVTSVLKKTKYFQKEVEVTGNKTEPQEVLVIGGLELPLKKKSGGTLDEIYSDEGLSEEGKRTLMKLLQLCRQRANGEEIDWDTAQKEIRKCSSPLTTKTVKSCPNLDAETEDKTGKLKLSESLESFMSARSTLSANSSKSSLEHFRHWKTKLNETRQTCEALLAELQSFAEIHSKVKFREAIEKKNKDEMEFIKRIRQYRKCRRFGRGKSRKGEGRDKMDDDGLKCWDGGGDAEFVPLAINSETGAVRNVNLPKMKQRSRPLLPSGSSGHGRKIDLSLEQACCH